MLTSLVVRYAGFGDRESDRYAGWVAALQRLRDEDAAGRRANITELPGYLVAVPDEQHADAMQDLIATHLTLNWRNGHGEFLNAYAAVLGAEIPSLRSPATVPVDLVEDEFLARFAEPHGDHPRVSEYTRRFPDRPDITARLAARCVCGGRYVRLHRLGLGACGEVWRAYDRHRRTHVALKRPRAAGLERAEALRQLISEVRATERVNHAGCITLREEFFAGDPEPVFIMRFASGPTLRERIRAWHAPELPVTTAVLAQARRNLLHALANASDAVAHAHQQRVAHGDLTPSNLVLTADGSVAVLDWGFARDLTVRASHKTRTVAGTPEYMAPEQLDGTIDERSDVFALGALLYEILAGIAPRGWNDEARPADWAERIRTAMIATPRSPHLRTPAMLSQLALRALARAPELRPPDAGAFAAELRAILEHTDRTSAGAWSRWRENLRHWCRCRRVQR